MNFFNKKDDELTPQRRLIFFGLAFVLAVLYDWLVYGNEQGLGLFVYIFLTISFFTLLSIILGQFRQIKALLLLIPIFCFSLSSLIYNNDLVNKGVPWFIILYILIFFILITLRNPDKYKFRFVNIPIISSIDLPFAKWSQIYHDIFKREDDNSSDLYRKIAWGVVIALPIVIIFAALFAKADIIFSNALNSIFDLKLPNSILWRVVRTIIFTLFVSGVFYVLIGKEHQIDNKESQVFKLDTTIVSTVLVLLNVLFLTFVFIQIKYLFGSAKYAFDNNILLAEYARNGFFELTWVIALVAILLLVVYRSLSRHGHHLFISAMQFLLILQTSVIAVSALKRMNIYQDAFGFTVKRLYVEWFIYFAVLILFLAAISILINWSFRKFLYTSIILGTIALSIVCLTNVDGMIAKENVDRYVLENKELDMHYLLNLSVDAYPQVARAFEFGYEYKVLMSSAWNDNLKKNENKYAVYNKNNYKELYTKAGLYIGDYYSDKTEVRVRYDYRWQEYNLNRFKVRDYISKI